MLKHAFPNLWVLRLLLPTIIMSLSPVTVELLRHSHGAPSLINHPVHDPHPSPLTLAGVEIIWWKDYVEWHLPANHHFRSSQHASRVFQSLFQCDPDPDGRCLAIFNLIIQRRLEPIFCDLPHLNDWEESCGMLKILHYLQVCTRFFFIFPKSLVILIPNAIASLCIDACPDQVLWRKPR